MIRRHFTNLCLIAAGRLFSGLAAGAEDLQPNTPSTGYPNATTPTLGGRQFWADQLFFDQWHIQRNVFTGHCRLLDGANVRHAWGSFDECRAKLEQIKTARRLPAMKGTGVVVLHGLFRSAASMSGMSRFLREQGDFTVFNVNYPTTRGTLADHAADLAKVLDSLEGISEIHFVAHSLGNLVVRHYLADQTRPNAGLQPDPRIRHMVMLGPPNRGAPMAEAFAKSKLFHFVAGPSAGQLASHWQQLEAKLATPEFPFGILAGGRGAETGYNPWLAGDNDLVVSVESTRLPGAADFAVLPVLHTLMMDDSTARQYTLQFLRGGFFVSPDKRRPIVAESSPS